MYLVFSKQPLNASVCSDSAGPLRVQFSPWRRSVILCQISVWRKPGSSRTRCWSLWTDPRESSGELRWGSSWTRSVSVQVWEERETRNKQLDLSKPWRIHRPKSSGRLPDNRKPSSAKVTNKQTEQSNKLKNGRRKKREAGRTTLVKNQIYRDLVSKPNRQTKTHSEVWDQVKVGIWVLSRGDAEAVGLQVTQVEHKRKQETHYGEVGAQRMTEETGNYQNKTGSGSNKTSNWSLPVYSVWKSHIS